MSFETISVIGLGYIGLPTAAIFASRKKMVIGVDINQETVDVINKGEIHIVEPELDIVVRATVAEGYLRAVTEPEPADAFLIAVPTPFNENHEPDLKFIQMAARALAPVLKSGDLVILESTSPVGSTEQMAEWLAKDRPDLKFPQDAGDQCDVSIAHCPERVLPGHVMRELIENGRVIGGLTARCSERARELYGVFVEGECVVTSARTAEMVKLTENAFRDVNIAFANELSIICDEQRINVWELVDLANNHPRVNILRPSAGVGGHCIAVDPWFIVSSNPDSARLIKQARLVNDAKPEWVVGKVLEAAKKTGKSKPNVACLGLAFKPDIDDLRESPALDIVTRMHRMDFANLQVIEPNIASLPDVLAGVTQVDIIHGIRDADILVFLVAHSAFHDIPASELKGKLVVDPSGVISKNR